MAKKKASKKSLLTKSEKKFLGHDAFIAGVVVAIIAGVLAGILPGLFATRAMITGVVIVITVLGVIVGFLNISRKETVTFLVAAIALLVTGATSLTFFNSITGWLGQMLYWILVYVEVFVAPAAFVVALKTIKSLEES